MTNGEKIKSDSHETWKCAPVSRTKSRRTAEESRTTHLHDAFAKYHNSKEEHVLRNCVAKMLYLRGPHISTFRGYQILFSIRNPNINRFTNYFSIHS
jgi:hypothetical protein